MGITRTSANLCLGSGRPWTDASNVRPGFSSKEIEHCPTCGQAVRSHLGKRRTFARHGAPTPVPNPTPVPVANP